VDGVVRDALDEPVTDARVVLVPSQTGLQGNSTFYRTASSDQYGRFVIQGVRPGDYQVMAWTRVQENAWMNPGFRQPFQTLAESVAVEKGDRETLDLRVIPGN
jgi:hypothetical protein